MHVYVYIVWMLQDDVGANIDELLHAQILDSVTTNPPATLVLLTGDGNMNGGTWQALSIRWSPPPHPPLPIATTVATTAILVPLFFSLSTFRG